jgi:branched-chain amino acid transport system permease protein
MIGGFYRPDVGSIRLGEELAGAPGWRVARAGIARTYQTTQLFGTMSVLANLLVGLRGGRLGGLATRPILWCLIAKAECRPCANWPNLCSA